MSADDADKQKYYTAEQARLLLEQALEKDKPDPMDVIRLKRMAEGCPQEHLNDPFYDPMLNPMLLGSFGGGRTVIRTEMRAIHGSSEEGAIINIAHKMFREELDNNEEYKALEDRIEGLREQAWAAKDARNYDEYNRIFDGKEFKDLCDQRVNMMHGIDAISHHKAEELVGIKLEDANQEIGSGKHLYEKFAEHTQQEVDPEYAKAALDASTTIDNDGVALSASQTGTLVSARDELAGAMEKLDALKANPSADPEQIAAAERSAGFAYDKLTDTQHTVGVYPDYMAAYEAFHGNAIEAFKPEPPEISALDTLDQSSLSVQGDSSLIEELRETGALPGVEQSDMDHQKPDLSNEAHLATMAI